MASPSLLADDVLSATFRQGSGASLVRWVL